MNTVILEDHGFEIRLSELFLSPMLVANVQHVENKRHKFINCQDSNASVDVRVGVNSEGEGVIDIVSSEEEEVDVVSCEVTLYSNSGIQFSEVKMKSY